MKKITVNGIEIEFSDGCDIVIDGNKITVKASRSEVIHYHQALPAPGSLGSIVFPGIAAPWPTPNYWQNSTNAAIGEAA